MDEIKTWKQDVQYMWKMIIIKINTTKSVTTLCNLKFDQDWVDLTAAKLKQPYKPLKLDMINVCCCLGFFHTTVNKTQTQPHSWWQFTGSLFPRQKRTFSSFFEHIFNRIFFSSLEWKILETKKQWLVLVRCYLFAPSCLTPYFAFSVF